MLSSKYPNNCFISTDSKIILCRNFIKKGDALFIVGQEFTHKTDLHAHPWPSSYFGVFKVSALSDMQVWPFSTFKTKAVNLSLSSFKEKFAVFELLHFLNFHLD